MRWGLSIALLGAGCMPPPMNVGYVDLTAPGRGTIDVQGQVGGGAELTAPAGGGGVVAHFEPFVARRVTIPIGTGLGISGRSGGAQGHLPLRVGVRHRAVPRHFAWGAGIGPSVAFDGDGALVAGVADLELVAGTKTRRVGFSFGIRPAFSFDPDAMTFYTLFEPTFAVPIRRSSLTLGVIAGPWVTATEDDPPAGGFLAFALGLHRRF